MKWTAIILSLALMCFSAAPAQAEPSVKRNGNTFVISEGVTDDVLAQVKAELAQADKKKLAFKLEKITDEDLGRLCAAHPDMLALAISKSEGVSSITPAAKLGSLRSIKLNGTKVADLTPLSGLTGLEALDLTGADFAPDLKWMAGLNQLTSIKIDAGKSLTSIEGLPKLPGLQSISICSASPADLSPLLNLPALRKVELRSCVINDLTPLAKLENMEELDLYGTMVKDFSPLAQCPKLKKLTYYAAQKADFSTLGRLTQVENLQGGLTVLDDISWVTNLPNLRQFRVFAESITDYSPLAESKVEHFTIWGMKKPVNLKQLDGAVSLKYLKLWSLEGTTGFEGLASLSDLKELIVDNVNHKEGQVDLSFAKSLGGLETMSLVKITATNSQALASLTALKKLEARELNAKEGAQPFDLSFLATLTALETLNLSGSKVDGFDAIAGCSALQTIQLTKTSGISNLAPLKKLPALKTVTVTKDAFPEAELSGFANRVKIKQQ